MKNSIAKLTGLIASATLILALGCKSKPKVAKPSGEALNPAMDEAAPPPPASRNAFLGAWVGKDSSGAAYTFRFANNLRWESYIEEGGSSRPHYRGTYEPQGTKVLLKVLEEVDLKTFQWQPERGGMPTNLTGSLSGSTLKLPNVLTEAELKRH